MTVASENNSRERLLHEYGRFYGDEHLAVAFTAGIQGDAAKRVLTKGWDKTTPLPDGNYAAAYVAGRGMAKNPVVVLRPSNLIVLECDTEADLVRIQELDLPDTITVRSSEPYKQHFWFRPPRGLEALPFVAFRFESGKLTADAGRYFLCPPAIHPSGAVYGFLKGPEDTGIAELPEPTYRELCEHARASDDDLREALEIDPEMKIKAGKRREMVFRYACMLRRWGLSEHEILEACQRFNLARCHPPVDYHQVQIQVDGAMKKHGDQELAAAFAEQDDGFRLQVITAQALCDEPDVDTGQLLGPLVLTAGRTIVVGDTGEGKTTLVFQLVRTILNGDDFLGWEGAGSGRALIIDLEQGRRAVKRSLRDAHLTNHADVDLVLVPDGLALDRDSEHFDELDRVIAEGGYTIVALDPYYKAHRSDEPNAERPIVDLMRMLDRLRTDYGFALILPAHPRKPLVGSETRKLTIHDVAGSGAVVRGAEVVLGIERVRHGASRLRFLKDREGDLRIGEAWSLLFDKHDGFVRDPADLEPDKDYRTLVLHALADREWHTVRGDLTKLTKSGVEAIQNALTVLLEERLVDYAEGSPPGKTKNSKNWRLSPSSEPSGKPEEAVQHPSSEPPRKPEEAVQTAAFPRDEISASSDAVPPLGGSTEEEAHTSPPKRPDLEPKTPKEATPSSGEDGLPF